MTRRNLSREHRSVAVAVVISGCVGVVAAVLFHHSGADPSTAVIAGGAAFGATMTLVLEVLKYLRGL
ncbi:hypothetical protein ACQP08_22035 [Micromonospora zamorensis]|uniref:Uncharacterized protein n=1 Tax=Micromonospora inaquosa TaxID=2203716 RepID=A0A3N9WXM8_9ACTN|nr:hypothetical protein [Micromonospora inaquosa]RQX05606.1 hypothetical protein DLJ59_07085 [Micromonospora inaquosa]